MNREVIIGDHKINYYLRKSRRARNLRITIYCDGNVAITLPNRMNESFVDKFIYEKSAWILRKLEHIKSYRASHNGLLHLHNTKEYKESKKQAFNFISNKLDYYNNFYRFDFRRISIRNQKTRWGSCSRKGNLNFNYKVMFLPERQADYIIVHELCHLKEFNHSARFWNLVKNTIPEYKKIVKEIRGKK